MSALRPAARRASTHTHTHTPKTAPKNTSIVAPTHKALVDAYRSIVEEAFRGNTAVPMNRAPAGLPKNAKGVDITRKGTTDQNRVVYEVKHKLYMKEIGFGGFVQWFKVGVAPQF
ncbi:MAG: hypothetical protein K1X64_13285 [Myxococcaceae bacterium]|nr:hypothetical protein [Myxococcaceae bacterium]